MKVPVVEMLSEPRPGRSLSNRFGSDAKAPTPVYLRRVNGSGVELLPYSRAAALLKHVTASPALHVTGDLSSGFAWPIPGAIPRHSTAVIPLAAPTWPHSPFATALMIELWWAADAKGCRKVRAFYGFFTDPFDAYLAACCLWSMTDTGGGAVAALLYGADRVPYLIEKAASPCGQLPEAQINLLKTTAQDCCSLTPPPPDCTANPDLPRLVDRADPGAAVTVFDCWRSLAEQQSAVMP